MNNNLTAKWDPKLYNDKHAFVYAYGEELIKLLNPQAHERILDLGCGSGQLTSKIKGQALEVVGIDKSSEMISDAKTKFPNIDFRVANATEFNFEDPFDAIFSNATLHWILDYKSAIQSMYKNLKPNGRIVLEFGGKGNVQTIVKQLRESLKSRGYFKQSNLNLWYFPSIGSYATALESEGFSVVQAEHFERPTELADEQSGIKDWISMFAKNFFIGVSETDIAAIKTEVQEKVKDQCLINGKWFADYKRIRIVAIKSNL